MIRLNVLVDRLVVMPPVVYRGIESHGTERGREERELNPMKSRLCYMYIHPSSETSCKSLKGP